MIGKAYGYFLTKISTFLSLWLRVVTRVFLLGLFWFVKPLEEKFGRKFEPFH